MVINKAGSSKKSVIRAHIIATAVRRPIYAVTLNVLKPSIENPHAIMNDVPTKAMPTVSNAYFIASFVA
jgi:hypothetical protein